MKSERLGIKHYLHHDKGCISAHMGMDLFVTLLLVFLISTAILLKTPEEEVGSAARTKEEEMRTPEINLTKDDQGGRAIGRKKAMSVSARRKADGTVEYFVGDKRTDLQGMAGVLKNKVVRSVELRLAEELTNSVTVRVLGQLQKAGVKEIYYVFIKKQKGGS